MSRLLRVLILAAAGLMLPPAQARDTVSIVFTGDLMLDDGPGRTIAAGGDPLQHVDSLLRGADLRIGNLECPVSRRGTPLESKIFTFRAEPSALRVLAGRFDALSVANNHSGDQGQEAFLDTLDHVRDAGLQPFGGGADLAQAHEPLWVQRGGLRIAVLGYDEFKPRRFEAGATWPGVAWSEDSHVRADIRAARAAGADIVIPFMHWGWERETQPSARQRALARLMIEAGADAVVGSHPHVTQGADTWRGKPIVWSLGNFVFDSFTTPETTTGWLLHLEVDARGVVSARTHPVRMDEAGTPHPAPQLPSPCWRRGEKRFSACPAP